jgi:hypothetical protein
LRKLANLLARRPIVLVLGMHRSGTSALARTLALAGGALPRTLFAPVAGDNDLGYWESRPLIEYHEALFARIGTSMLADMPIDPAWFDSRDARRAERDLLAIVRSEWRDGVLASRAPWIVKEPRIARLMPLWRRILAGTGRRVVAVHMLREPGEVAASLLRRPELAASGFTAAAAERSWLEHVVLAERGTRGLPRTFASIDLLMGEWRTVVARVATILRDGSLDADRAAAEIDAFLRPGLRHHRAGTDARLPSDDIGRVRDAMLDAVRWGGEPDADVIDAAHAAIVAPRRANAAG